MIFGEGGRGGCVSHYPHLILRIFLENKLPTGFGSTQPARSLSGAEGQYYSYRQFIKDKGGWGLCPQSRGFTPVPRPNLDGYCYKRYNLFRKSPYFLTTTPKIDGLSRYRYGRIGLASAGSPWC